MGPLLLLFSLAFAYYVRVRLPTTTLLLYVGPTEKQHSTGNNIYKKNIMYIITVCGDVIVISHIKYG